MDRRRLTRQISKAMEMNCPACHLPLFVERSDTGRWMLFCARGGCRNEAANRGIQIDPSAIQKAYNELVVAVEAEEQEKD